MLRPSEALGHAPMTASCLVAAGAVLNSTRPSQ
jgi:hypothetical protein